MKFEKVQYDGVRKDLKRGADSAPPRDGFEESRLGGLAPPTWKFRRGMPPKKKYWGGGQTRFSKISLYLVIKELRNFRGAFGAAKTSQFNIKSIT